jgi:DNA-directed RNA polymerase specialized sigma subunit
MDSYLEEEFAEPFHAWKANPTPEANAQILKTLHPVIEQGVKAHVGDANPLMMSRARKLALNGLRSYDPARSRLKTHLYTQLQGMKRIARQQGQVIQAPERVQLDAYHLKNHEQELSDSLGRDPSDAELADHTGFSLKRIAHVRQFQPGVSEGTMDAVAPNMGIGMQAPSKSHETWVQMVYEDLPVLDQRILEHTLGLHGRPQMSNQALARKLGRSPGAISQRKARIQQLLDQEEELSPFLGET